MDGVEQRARSKLVRQRWVSRRGKATRLYLRRHPGLAERFALGAEVEVPEKLPTGVTRSSLLGELASRARRREITRELRQWRQENPEEAAAIARRVREGVGYGE